MLDALAIDIVEGDLSWVHDHGFDRGPELAIVVQIVSYEVDRHMPKGVFVQVCFLPTLAAIIGGDGVATVEAEFVAVVGSVLDRHRSENSDFLEIL